MKIFTIGFTRKSAGQFFSLLCDAGVKRLIDVRLNNVSQLAGFTKKEDLRYFVRVICGIEYIHLPELAPSAEILDAYKKRKGGWAVYAQQFNALMQQREIEKILPRDLLAESCLLCSEETAEHCHRRLVAEYLQQHWGQIDIVHLS
jgi:uncharacterized protein (DUF488 family)